MGSGAGEAKTAESVDGRTTTGLADRRARPQGGTTSGRSLCLPVFQTSGSVNYAAADDC